MEPNYYEALGVPCDASNAEISRAYQKKVMDEESPVSDEEFMVLAEALDVLTDPDTRKLYDLENGIRPNAPGDDGYRVSEDAHEHANPQDFFYRRDFRRMRYGAERWIPVAGNENYYGPFPSSLRPNVPLQQDPPVVRDLRVSLEDVFHGCTKRMRISQKRFDPFRGVRRTFHNTVKIEVKPGWKVRFYR